MKAIVIPVKAFADAKSRLAPHLSAGARAQLAEALCAETFDVMSGISGVDRVFVVSSEPRALRWARDRGWDAIAETEQVSESESVDLVCRLAQELGIGTLLRIPADLPLVQATDIDAVFAAQAGSPGCLIVPSRDGTGTNALLRSPPQLFPSFFGSGSFEKHLSAARRCGVEPVVLHNPRIALDIDDAADLELLKATGAAHARMRRWVNEINRAPRGGSDPSPIPKPLPL